MGSIISFKFFDFFIQTTNVMCTLIQIVLHLKNLALKLRNFLFLFFNQITILLK